MWEIPFKKDFDVKSFTSAFIRILLCLCVAWIASWLFAGLSSWLYHCTQWLPYEVCSVAIANFAPSLGSVFGISMYDKYRLKHKFHILGFLSGIIVGTFTGFYLLPIAYSRLFGNEFEQVWWLVISSEAIIALGAYQGIIFLQNLKISKN